MRNYDNLVNIAKSLKKQYQTGQCFHVAFAMKGGAIIDIATNSYFKSNSISYTYVPTKTNSAIYTAGIHAEMAITGRLKYRTDMSALTLVLIRIDNNNKVATSEPCANCAYQLGKLNIRRIIYSTNDGTFLKFPTNIKNN